MHYGPSTLHKCNHAAPVDSLSVAITDTGDAVMCGTGLCSYDPASVYQAQPWPVGFGTQYWTWDEALPRNESLPTMWRLASHDRNTHLTPATKRMAAKRQLMSLTTVIPAYRFRVGILNAAASLQPWTSCFATD